MAEYTFEYELDPAPQARRDGSGMLDHQVNARVSIAGAEAIPIPGRRKTICVPEDEITAALAEATTGAKVAAYKNALVRNLHTAPTPVTGWGNEQLSEMLDKNAAAASAAAAANEFITVTLGQTYPVQFTV